MAMLSEWKGYGPHIKGPDTKTGHLYCLGGCGVVLEENIPKNYKWDDSNECWCSKCKKRFKEDTGEDPTEPAAMRKVEIIDLLRGDDRNIFIQEIGSNITFYYFVYKCRMCSRVDYYSVPELVFYQKENLFDDNFLCRECNCNFNEGAGETEEQKNFRVTHVFQGEKISNNYVGIMDLIGRYYEVIKPN